MNFLRDWKAIQLSRGKVGMDFSMVGDMKGVNSEQVSGDQAFSGV